jgi:hypothetical protein
MHVDMVVGRLSAEELQHRRALLEVELMMQRAGTHEVAASIDRNHARATVPPPKATGAQDYSGWLSDMNNRIADHRRVLAKGGNQPSPPKERSATDPRGSPRTARITDDELPPIRGARPGEETPRPARGRHWL